MYLYTRFSGKANPLIKQVFPCLLSSGFSLTFCPGGNLIILLQLKEITDCWEWVDAFHLPWKFFVFWFFFSFQFCQQIKLWEEVFRKPTLEGGTGLLSCRVCFLQDFSLWLRLSCCFCPSQPSHFLIASPPYFYFSLFLRPSNMFFPHTFVCHYPFLTNFSFCPLLPWLSPLSLLSIFYPPVSPKHHIMRNRLDCLLGSSAKSTMSMPGWADMIWYYRYKLEISKRGYCGTLRFLALPQGI